MLGALLGIQGCRVGISDEQRDFLLLCVVEEEDGTLLLLFTRSGPTPLSVRSLVITALPLCDFPVDYLARLGNTCMRLEAAEPCRAPWEPFRPGASGMLQFGNFLFTKVKARKYCSQRAAQASQQLTDRTAGRARCALAACKALLTFHMATFIHIV